MKRRELLIKLGALGLMGMAPALSGCIGGSTSTSPEATATPTTAPVAATTTSSTTTIESLYHTCSKGKRCTSPQCGMWSDLNGDNKCDRGYF